MTTKPESRESLVMLVISPSIWALHFLASYLTAAIWCAKLAGPDRSLQPARTAIAIYTAVALLAIGATAVFAYRRHRFANEPVPHDWDTSGDRHRFLGYATLLLSGLSAIATLFVALTIVFIGSCH